MRTHYSLENPATVFDEEAMTALELAGRTTAKVNEMVEAFNELETETTRRLTDQDKAIPVKVTEEVDRYIECGEFDSAIDKYAGELEDRLDNLLGSVPVGSTTMDAEVIDGRQGEDGTTYSNLGEAIRKQFGKSLRAVTHTFTNADHMITPGFYFKGGSDVWENVPDTMKETAGVIVSFAPDPAKFPSRIVQMAIDYNGVISTRNMSGTAFNQWVPHKSPAEGTMTMVETDTTITYDADVIMNSGYYHFGSSHKVLNAPTAFGLLVVYRGKLEHQVYQMWVDYFTNDLYVRNYAINQGFRDWVKTVATGSNSDASALPYRIEKVNHNFFYVYKKGSNGYIRYGVGYDYKPEINLDTYRLMTIDHVDNDLQKINTISGGGADVEGVIQLEGEGDHIGGVHGDEQASDYNLFVDGKEYTFANVPNMECGEIRLYVASKLFHADTSNHAFDRTKEVVFDKDGVHIRNSWVPVEMMAVSSIRGGMLSIDKENITHYTDSLCSVLPYRVPAMTESSSILLELTGDEKLTFMGGISATQWFETLGMTTGLESAVFGETKNRGGFVQDYGDRLKSYYTVWNNYTPEVSEACWTTNHFNIVC